MKPIISIIVPIYNVDKYLEKCVDSILNQALEEFELILVNDGSTDDSGIICDKYTNEDKRVKVVHKKNGGVSSARNIGVKSANGEYIGFVDPDDYIDKYMYKNLYELCEKSNSDIGICKLGREIDGIIINNSNEEKILELNNINAMNELFKGELYRFSLCNKIFKRKCFENVFFPEGRIHEDLSTTYKLFANSDKAIYTAYIGYIYVKRENSILTSTYSEKRLQAFIGWNEILKYISSKYPQLEKQLLASYSYWCIDNIFYIIKQVSDDKIKLQYINVIRENINNNYMNIIKNKLIYIKYKVIITIIKYNPKIFLKYYKIN